ncbi:MAG: hypothetical protein OXT64_18510 [Gammaproteobacteria bacterium]|nr:hypothetical protein [Gammaproteobacteria bacterium]
MRPILATAGLLLALSSSASVQLPAIISDGLVLQQGVPIVLWGWADPGEGVSAWIGTSSGTTQALEDGTWRLALPPLDAGGPHELVISGASDTLRVVDVLVGEVWLGSGQSNMRWPVSGAADAEQEIRAADYPALRMFTVERNATAEPQRDVAGNWRTARPGEIAEFSAVGYFFSRHLHRELGVPVGFIHSSWGGTPAEAWTRRDAFDKPTLAPVLARQTQAMEGMAKDRAAFDLSLSRLEPAMPSSNDLEGVWDTLMAFGQQEFQFPMVITVDADVPTVAFDGFGTEVAAPVDISADGVGWTFVAKSGGETTVRAIYGPGVMSGTVSTSQSQLSIKSQKRDPEAGAPVLVGIAPSGRVSHLFNAMIDPITPYRIKGVVWYQGESNAKPDQAYLYAELFATMIEDWRLAWAQPLPFYFVQLANFGARETEPPLDSPWAEVRDAQRRTLALPHTAMAVAIDIGEADDIHPRNKQEVGRRLALAALARQYGKLIAYSGPLYREARFDKAEVEVSFDHAEGLNTVGGDEVVGFAIAGADRKFVWANARIKGERVVVWSDAVRSPQSVRYGWGVNPATNLTNGAGLPASPFRTDQW